MKHFDYERAAEWKLLDKSDESDDNSNTNATQISQQRLETSIF
jgi:hypothetical protein